MLRSSPLGYLASVSTPPHLLQVNTGVVQGEISDTITVPVTIDITDGLLGVTTLEIQYDPNVLEPIDCIKNPDGIFDAMTCNKDYETDGINPDVVRFSALSASGISGRLLHIVDLHFTLIGEVGTEPVLNSTIETGSDPGGTPLILDEFLYLSNIRVD